MALKRVAPAVRTSLQNRLVEKRRASATVVPAISAEVTPSSSALAWNSGRKT